MDEQLKRLMAAAKDRGLQKITYLDYRRFPERDAKGFEKVALSKKKKLEMNQLGRSSKGSGC